jgi:hypothetical protein
VIGNIEREWCAKDAKNLGHRLLTGGGTPIEAPIEYHKDERPYPYSDWYYRANNGYRNDYKSKASYPY